jgi:aminoglycoside phosphotransferase (APT) family kinase protein
MSESDLLQPDRTQAIVTELVGSVGLATGRYIVERVPESHSTEVYRIRQPGAVLYLRILPERDASFAPEAYAHSLLRMRQVRVPEVIYFEHYNPALRRSAMVTTEILGQAIGHGLRPPNVRQIVRQAGRELARINQIPVHGFGWIVRDQPIVDELRAEYATYAQWIQHHVGDLVTLLGSPHVLAQPEVDAIRLVMAEALDLFGEEPAYLAHGDFDGTHIYYHNDQYTGIIDFGEIRGANQLYDLGHYYIENADLLPDLLEGYGEVIALPADHMRRILVTGVLIAARRVGLSVMRNAALHAPDVLAIKRSLRMLNAL